MEKGERLFEADVYDGSLPARLTPSIGGLLLRSTLLFAGALLVVAMIAVPLADRGVHALLASGEPGIDMMETGSIDGSTRHYQVRRSVLQAPGSAPCIVFPDGTSTGGC